MRLPSKVNICGQEWKVERGSDFYGGRFTTHPGTITIGKIANQDEKAMIFMHEVIESTLTVLGHRYDGNENMVFVMDHDEFENSIFSIYEALKGVLKK